MPDAKVLVAQLGARKNYQEPLLFHRWSILDKFYTDFYSGDNSLSNFLRCPSIYNLLPGSLKKILDRYEPQLRGASVTHFPKFGYQYIQALKKASPEQAAQLFVWGGQEFCKHIIQHGLGNANIIYGFNSACLELFQYAKVKGIRCVLDQTLADYSQVHRLLLEEEQKWPDWSLTPFAVGEASLKLLQREQDEQDLADQIICGSTFVESSLIARGVPANKISVVPLGRLKSDPLLQHRLIDASPKERSDGLRILFIGSVGLRKGIPYLLNALRQIDRKIPFTCKVVGPIEIKPERIAEYQDVCEFIGRLPRSAIKELYLWADVFVLPSICEGSAMVTYEAMSLGLPIITTPNAGSIVRDNVDGFIVPIQDTQAIAEKLIRVYREYQRFQKETTQQYLKQLFSESEHRLRSTIEATLLNRSVSLQSL
jgi:glycosyltransferase involved in cell wall biosynthesis